MDSLAHDCHQALQQYNGHLLASTISPIPPPRFLNRLEAIYHSSNHASIQKDVSHALAKNAHRSISLEDRQILDTWSEIYVVYWRAVGALVAASEAEEGQADYARVYDSWKEVVNAVIRGYTTGMLEAWTLPVLYLAGRYLRIFAIKADESKKSAEGNTGIDMGGIQDDIAGDFGKNEKLEDAARVLNRMFTLCISDRYVASNTTSSAITEICDKVHQWRSPGNGASITSPVSSSRPTSNSTPSAYPRISSVPSPPRAPTCLRPINSQRPTSSHTSTTSASSSSSTRTTKTYLLPPLSISSLFTNPPIMTKLTPFPP